MTTAEQRYGRRSEELQFGDKCKGGPSPFVGVPAGTQATFKNRTWVLKSHTQL